MKKIKALSIFMMLFTAIAFTSCDTEPVDSELVNPTVDNENGGIDNGGNTGGGNPGGNVGDRTGNYWPLAMGNSWTFSEGTNTQPMTITSTVVEDGFTYYKMENLFGDSTANQTGVATYLARYDNGKYRIKASVEIGSTPQMPDAEVSPYEYSIVRDDLPVGGTWEEDVEQTTTYTGMPPIITNNNFKGRIIAKDVTISVNGRTYTNILQSELTLSVSFPDLPMPPTVVTTTYWFAKDIGPVKAQTVTSFDTITSQLTAYTVN
jgi:hypothetical protein